MTDIYRKLIDNVEFEKALADVDEDNEARYHHALDALLEYRKSLDVNRRHFEDKMACVPRKG